MYRDEAKKLLVSYHAHHIDILIESRNLATCRFQSNWNVRLIDTNKIYSDPKYDSIFNNGIKCLGEKMDYTEFLTLKREIIDGFDLVPANHTVKYPDPFFTLFFDPLALDNPLIFEIDTLDQVALLETYFISAANVKAKTLGQFAKTILPNTDKTYLPDTIIHNIFTNRAAELQNEAEYDDLYNNRDLIDRHVTGLNIIVYYFNTDKSLLGKCILF